MTDKESPIFEFYPEKFEQDLNGKKQDWEAVVLIPFIDEGKLLKVMEIEELKLSKEEAHRNARGLMTSFT
jgi:5'-3' exoribonuclease 1